VHPGRHVTPRARWFDPNCNLQRSGSFHGGPRCSRSEQRAKRVVHPSLSAEFRFDFVFGGTRTLRGNSTGCADWSSDSDSDPESDSETEPDSESESVSESDSESNSEMRKYSGFNRRFVDCAYPSAHHSRQRTSNSTELHGLPLSRMPRHLWACTIHKAPRSWNTQSTSPNWHGLLLKLFSERTVTLLRKFVVPSVQLRSTRRRRRVTPVATLACGLSRRSGHSTKRRLVFGLLLLGGTSRRLLQLICLNP
jgi:hypothetical protein